jgi:hypothetical protein
MGIHNEMEQQKRRYIYKYIYNSIVCIGFLFIPPFQSSYIYIHGRKKRRSDKERTMVINLCEKEDTKSETKI